MKKIFSLFAVLFISIFTVYADWGKCVGVGIGIPIVSNTIFWDDLDDGTEMGSEHHTGSGFDIFDGQFRLINQNGFALMFNEDLSYLAVDDADGINSMLNIGLGIDFINSDTNRFIVSLTGGFNISELTSSTTEDSITADMTLFFVDVMGGVDLFYTHKVSDVLGFFVQVSMYGCAGITVSNVEAKRGRYSYSNSYTGDDEEFFFVPKIGLTWQF